MNARYQRDCGEKMTGEFRKIHRGDHKTVPANPETRKFTAASAKKGEPNRKQFARLMRRRMDYSATLTSKAGYHRPGSMQ